MKSERSSSGEYGANILANSRKCVYVHGDCRIHHTLFGSKLASSMQFSAVLFITAI